MICTSSIQATTSIVLLVVVVIVTGGGATPSPTRMDRDRHAASATASGTGVTHNWHSESATSGCAISSSVRLTASG